MVSALESGRQTVSVLEADPDLRAGLPEHELEAAHRRAMAALIELDRPDWDPKPIGEQAEPGWLGLFVVEGLLIRRVTVGKRAACELFGPGDLLRPWDTDGEYDPLPIQVDWLVLKPARLAVLDTAFVLRTA